MDFEVIIYAIYQLPHIENSDQFVSFIDFVTNYFKINKIPNLTFQSTYGLVDLSCKKLDLDHRGKEKIEFNFYGTIQLDLELYKKADMYDRDRILSKEIITKIINVTDNYIENLNTTSKEYIIGELDSELSIIQINNYKSHSCRSILDFHGNKSIV